MAKATVEILTPVGRMVGGHPMEMNLKTNNDGTPKFQKDGVTQASDCYVGLAIPKDPAAPDWKQTPWGQQIVQVAMAGWPNGETQRPDFAWKVIDGDSMIPNKNGKKPAEREGYPGHWVLNTSHFFTPKCYHAGKFDPTQQIQDKNTIKRGDYCRLGIACKDNGPSESPGVYLNPFLFELTRAGQEIIVESGSSATEMFGAMAGQVPANALVDNGVVPQNAAQAVPAGTPAAAVATPNPAAVATPNPAAAAAPAADLLTPAPAPAPAAEPARLIDGARHTEAALRAAGWLDPQINALPLAP